MTVRIYAKHLPYANGHIAKIEDEMDLAGAPTIRAVRYGDHLIALEGSHRLAAAHAAKLAPKVVLLPTDGGGLELFFDIALDRLPVYEFDDVLFMELDDVADRIVVNGDDV